MPANHEGGEVKWLDETEDSPSLEVTAPHSEDNEPIENPWTLVAQNRQVLKGWTRLSRSTQQNVVHCYDWLRRHATERKPGRCYALKGQSYAGHWCYEIGAGDRVYYRPEEASRTAVIWYAGAHPKDGIPPPPKPLAPISQRSR